MTIDILPMFFFLIALIYSTVGFAGGSSYLLVLTLAGLPHGESAAVALVSNLVVSSLALWHFRAHLRFRLVLPFMALSFPMAFLGSTLSISKETFLILLALCLAAAAWRLLFTKTDHRESRIPPPKELWSLGLPVGAVMGFFSGLIGLGGGIFLSPFLLLSRWASMKEASAAASFFIFVNSAAGFWGKARAGLHFPDSLPLLLLTAFMGGWAGSRLGSSRLPQAGLQRVLALLMIWISMNLLSKAL